MYAYCNNNPVMYTDPSGHIGIGAILLTIGIVLSIAATAHDVFQLTRSVDDDKKTKIVLEENDIKIENSYLILTPWIVLGYSVYANHFDSDSKDDGGVAIYVSVLFASTERPQNNKKQNEQFRAAMRELKITDRDV